MTHMSSENETEEERIIRHREIVNQVLAEREVKGFLPNGGTALRPIIYKHCPKHACIRMSVPTMKINLGRMLGKVSTGRNFLSFSCDLGGYYFDPTSISEEEFESPYCPNS